MKRTPLTAILTLVAVLASSLAVTGCGGKSGSSSAKPTTSSTPTTSTTTHKHSSKPAY
jgi:ABC-type glycerol-3-phosphate transport system substrate-binding protein